MNHSHHAAVGSESVTELCQRPLSLIGLLLVQVLIGYEWVISGLTKVVRGGFPPGLADELRDTSQGSPGWYVKILDYIVIPHGQVFGYLIEIGELLVGILLIGGALIWRFAWGRAPLSLRVATLALIALSALAGVFMNVNFHLADGSATSPWLLPGDPFSEGVDLDSLMAAIQIPLAAVAAGLLWRMWRLHETGDSAAIGSARSPRRHRRSQV